MNHKHGCVIVYNDKEIVAQGFNHDNCTMNDIYSVHAEVNAINQLRKNIRSKDKKFIQKCSLYVVRVGSPLMNYPLKNSEPCENCTKSILKMGIPKVYYSTNDEFLSAFEDQEVKKLLSTQGRPVTPPSSNPRAFTPPLLPPDASPAKNTRGRPVTPPHSNNIPPPSTHRERSPPASSPPSHKKTLCIIS
jgi:deoxycytidylate deaminase